jgi:O-acetylhomoserine (thiol)-lyase
MLVFFALLGEGDEFLAAKQLYGGSINQFKNSFSRAFNWNCKFVDATKPEDFREAIGPKTKAIFIESIANPGGIIIDIEKVAKIADEAGIPLIVDNTMASPYLCRPFDYGAHIVTHSTTKFLSGQGNSVGGAFVDSGRFDWMKYPDKYPALNRPEPGYHGMVFAEKFREMALTIHGHAVGLRDLGCCQQPMNAFITINGIETLALRMERHCANAQAVAEYLENHPKILWVNYAGLSSSQFYPQAQKYTGGKGGAVFTFGLKDGFEAGVKLVESVRLFSHLANIGDTRSLIIHPASTTHAQLTDSEKTAAGAGPEVIRISVGIETIDDIIGDLDMALSSI